MDGVVSKLDKEVSVQFEEGKIRQNPLYEKYRADQDPEILDHGRSGEGPKVG